MRAIECAAQQALKGSQSIAAAAEEQSSAAEEVRQDRCRADQHWGMRTGGAGVVGAGRGSEELHRRGKSASSGIASENFPRRCRRSTVRARRS